MYNKIKTKRTWVEVDLDQLEKNYKNYKSFLNKGTKIMAVVKAEAYGHGDVAVCKKLIECGVEIFAVSNLDEAISLRVGGIKEEILILGYTPCENAKDIFKFNLTQTLIDEFYANELAKSNYKLKVQMAIDTGMNRIGINADNPSACKMLVYKYSKIFNLNGIYTHLCIADEKDIKSIEFTRQQIEKFNKIVKMTQDLNLKYLHCLNSVGGNYYNVVGNFVRLGIMLYGMKPNIKNEIHFKMKPILSWKSIIAMIKTVNIGETIGYGRTYIVKSTMRVATIPVGYADGYRRELSNKGYVLINGKRAKILGRVCMDQIMVDVTNVDCRPQDEVVLIGRSKKIKFLAEDMASLIGTIGYEIVCGISKRVPRKYV